MELGGSVPQAPSWHQQRGSGCKRRIEWHDGRIEPKVRIEGSLGDDSAVRSQRNAATDHRWVEAPASTRAAADHGGGR
jgi:hypothetical protein